MNIVVKEKIQLIYFFAGFVLLAFAGLPMVAIVFLATLVAYLVYLSSGKTAVPVAGVSSDEGSDGSYEDDDLF